MSALGLAVAVVSAIVAIVARRDSARSAKAAEDSLEVQRTEAARATELRDVLWELVNCGTRGLLIYRNRGTTDALDVVAAVSINGERFEVRSARVPAGGSIEFDGQSLYQEAEQRAAKASFSSPGFSSLRAVRFGVRAQISWKSELGTPAAQSVPADDA